MKSKIAEKNRPCNVLNDFKIITVSQLHQCIQLAGVGSNWLAFSPCVYHMDTVQGLASNLDILEHFDYGVINIKRMLVICMPISNTVLLQLYVQQDFIEVFWITIYTI